MCVVMGDGRLFSRNESGQIDRHNLCFTAVLSIKSSLSKRRGAGLGVSVTKERFHFYFKLVPTVFAGYPTVSPRISL